MPEQILINDKDEALDYLVLEKGLVDARIPLETAFYGVKAWLTSSEGLPPSLDGGDSHWLFPNGEIVSTHIVGPSIKKEYERQVGQPFPPKLVED
jgi:hypothetical protein